MGQDFFPGIQIAGYIRFAAGIQMDAGHQTRQARIGHPFPLAQIPGSSSRCERLVESRQAASIAEVSQLRAAGARQSVKVGGQSAFIFFQQSGYERSGGR